MATDLTNEVFVAVEGYEGAYEISNRARVKSLDREIQRNGRTYRRKGKFLRPRKNNKGYWQVPLSKDGKVSYPLLHRLVAKGFLTQPEGCDIVHHIDNDVDHNWPENLEYTTPSGNIQYAIDQNRIIARPVIRSDGKY